MILFRKVVLKWVPSLHKGIFNLLFVLNMTMTQIFGHYLIFPGPLMLKTTIICRKSAAFDSDSKAILKKKKEN